MDQVKIGGFLRELRKEKELSQEQLAERFGVSSRSVSRWENGNTMPDISILIELADYYDVDIREILNGERKSEVMNGDLKETLEMVADYTEAEKNKILNKVFASGLISSIIYMIVMIMYVYNIQKRSDAMEGLFIMLIQLGLIGTFSTTFCGLQLSGKMSKERIKKIRLIMLPVCIGLMILLTVMILAFMSA